MLVVAFEVEVGLGAVVAVLESAGRAGVAAAQDVKEGGSGIEADIEDVVALRVVRGREGPSAPSTSSAVSRDQASTPPSSTIAAARSISAMVSGCRSPLVLCRKNGSGAPQLRCRLMHQSGRFAIRKAAAPRQSGHNTVAVRSACVDMDQTSPPHKVVQLGVDRPVNS